ncbi:MAG: TlpA family protein disulfide reductase, partial [Phycisphaerales bacterium]|nr:TlpA family protein disulfide reductase [Phycisphaerae bacterium]NNM25649.1 TlpA family protein disulfide reductase [Phycisphaerales bacterium]
EQLERTRTAYRTAKAFTDRVEIVSEMAGRALPPEESTIALGPGFQMHVHSASSDVLSLGKTLVVTTATYPKRYLEVPLSGDPLETLRSVFGDYRGAMIGPALRYGRPFEEVLPALSFGLPDRIRLSSFRKIRSNAGTPLHQLTIISAAGATTVNIDPVTNLIVAAEVEYQPPNAPVGNLRIRRSLTFHPQVHAKLPTPITFDPAGRRRVRTLAGLRGEGEPAPPSVADAVKPGATAPPFALHTLEGRRIALQDLRGSVAVLIFWSDGNVASRRGIRQLTGLATWIETTDSAVRIIPIHTRAKGASPAEIWERVLDFWDRQELPFSSLLDPTDAVAEAYGVDELPIVVVVDAAGIVRWVGGSLDGDDVTAIRTQVKAALRKGA